MLHNSNNSMNIILGTEVKCAVGETSDNGGFTPGCECMFWQDVHF